MKKALADNLQRHRKTLFLLYYIVTVTLIDNFERSIFIFLRIFFYRQQVTLEKYS